MRQALPEGGSSRTIPSCQRHGLPEDIENTRTFADRKDTTRNNQGLGIVPQVMQARTGLSRPAAQPELACEPDEGCGQIVRPDRPAVAENEEPIATAAAAQADPHVALQCRPDAGMQGQEPGPAEFGLADPQAVRCDVLEGQAGRLRAPHARRGQQPEEVVEGDGSEGADWRQLRGGVHELADLERRQQSRRRAVIRAASQRVHVRNLVPLVLRVQVDGHLADESQPSLPLPG